MILVNVSFGILAMLPQGWLFMLLIILIESLILSKVLQFRWVSWPIYLRVLVSNAVSGLVGFFASLKLNGGWWLVIWFPWVSDNEVRDGDLTQLWLVYSIAFLLTLLIEIPINKWFLKKYPTRQTIKATLVANVASYVLGTLILYSYSFGLIRPLESEDAYPINNNFRRFTELLNESKEDLIKNLKEDYKITEVESEVRNKDSVRLSFNTNPVESFNLFITNDTLRYFVFAHYNARNMELTNSLSKQFAFDSLSSLQGEILENYPNEHRSAVSLFKDKKNSLGYLVVDYKEDSGRYATMVVWKLKNRTTK